MTTTATDSAPETKTTPAKTAPSPEALLKAAVSGAGESGTKPAEAPAIPAPATKRRLDPFLTGAAGALALGALLGAGVTALSTPRADHAGAAFAEVSAGIEASRVEAARLNTEIERLGKTVAALRETGEAARKESTARGNGMIERVGKMEQALAAKFASLSERVEQAEREQAARVAALAAQADKRPTVTAPVAALKPEPSKPEPTQTGSIGETKAAKPAVIDSWAVRDVYDGTAMLEDRRRRLVEVGAGDVIPGIGRVDAIERRGREWVVVTRAGIVTPQPW